MHAYAWNYWRNYALTFLDINSEISPELYWISDKYFLTKFAKKPSEIPSDPSEESWLRNVKQFARFYFQIVSL